MAQQKMLVEARDEVPQPGQWPVDPQHDQPVLETRIFIDGCFDFFHHGHAGVMLQARQLGDELLVGVHSDEDIASNKGPTVMNLKERLAAIDACRWVTKSIPHVPYTTSLGWMSHYGCKYVAHGDDITTTGDGEDTYRFVKEAGRLKIVKRTPGISTTDLVGRMLLCTKTHFIKSLKDVLAGKEGPGSSKDKRESAAGMNQRIREYSQDESGLAPGVDVYTWHSKTNEFEVLVPGKAPRSSQRIVYVDGGFDLFSSGHIEFLRSVVELEEKKAKKAGWYTEDAKAQRLAKTGEDYGPCYVVAGIHNDQEINQHKGLNYPIMNIFERGLCLLQCRYVHSVVFGAPFEPSKGFLENLPSGLPNVVYHGPTAFIPLGYDPYSDAKDLGLFEEVPRHDFQDVDAGQIVERITKSREVYEARQRAKGIKAAYEDEAWRKEKERDA